MVEQRWYWASVNGSAIGLRQESKTKESKECSTVTGPAGKYKVKDQMLKAGRRVSARKVQGFSDHHLTRNSRKRKRSRSVGENAPGTSF